MCSTALRQITADRSKGYTIHFADIRKVDKARQTDRSHGPDTMMKTYYPNPPLPACVPDDCRDVAWFDRNGNDIQTRKVVVGTDGRRLNPRRRRAAIRAAAKTPVVQRLAVGSASR